MPGAPFTPAAPCPDPKVVSAGFAEPSLVFLTRTDLAMPDADGTAAFLKEQPCRIAFVESRSEADFLAAAKEKQLEPRLLSRVDGIAINGGRHLDIGVYLGQ